MSLYTTFLVALLGFQIAAPEKITAIKSDAWQWVPVSAGFVAIVLYGLYVIVSYHNTIAMLNSLIANLAPDLELCFRKRAGSRKCWTRGSIS